LLILLGSRPYPIRGDYGKKDLQNANMKAQGGIRASLWSPFLPWPEKKEILSFVKKFTVIRKGGCPWIPEAAFRAGGDF
jgi:hypothetical protein